MTENKEEERKRKRVKWNQAIESLRPLVECAFKYVNPETDEQKNLLLTLQEQVELKLIVAKVMNVMCMLD